MNFLSEREAEHAEFLLKLRELLTSLPIFCRLKDPGYPVPKIVQLYTFDEKYSNENIVYMAEYLRMNGRTASEIKNIPRKMMELSQQYKLGIEANDFATDYLNQVSGEMAYQEVFPNKAPNWRHYYLAPEGE